MRWIVWFVLCGLCVSCGRQDGPREVGPIEREILEEGYSFARAESIPRDVGRTRLAFDLLQDMTQAQALEALIADGFDCDASVCVTTSQQRLGWLAINAGITNLDQTGVMVRWLTVSLLGDPIQTERDVTTSVGAEFYPDQ